MSPASRSARQWPAPNGVGRAGPSRGVFGGVHRVHDPRIALGPWGCGRAVFSARAGDGLPYRSRGASSRTASTCCHWRLGRLPSACGVRSSRWWCWWSSPSIGRPTGWNRPDPRRSRRGGHGVPSPSAGRRTSPPAFPPGPVHHARTGAAGCGSSSPRNAPRAGAGPTSAIPTPNAPPTPQSPPHPHPSTGLTNSTRQGHSFGLGTSVPPASCPSNTTEERPKQPESLESGIRPVTVPL